LEYSPSASALKTLSQSEEVVHAFSSLRHCPETASQKNPLPPQSAALVQHPVVVAGVGAGVGAGVALQLAAAGSEVVPAGQHCPSKQVLKATPSTSEKEQSLSLLHPAYLHVLLE